MELSTILTLLMIAAMVIPAALVTTGTFLGVSAFRKRRALAYLTAKRELSAKLIALDERITEVEIYEVDDALPRAGRARGHLNEAFAQYSRHFGADVHPGGNPKTAVVEVDRELQAANRILDASRNELAAERLIEVGKDFGREMAGLAKVASVRLLEAGTQEIRRALDEVE